MNEADDRDFVERYFAGDLDRVELRELERRLEGDDDFRVRFEADYDARIAEDPWAGMATHGLELADCFSPDTLERYVDGDLAPEDRAIVAAHLQCPWCRGQVEAISASRAEPQPNPNVVPLRARSQRRWAALPAAAAAAMFVLSVGMPPPPAKLDFEVVASAAERYRSTGAQLGDELRLAIDRLAGRSGAVRVYLQGEGLVLACPETEAAKSADDGTADAQARPRVPNVEPSDPLAEALAPARRALPKGQCSTTRDAVRASLKMTTPGTYDVVLIVDESTIPAPTGDVDDDIAAVPDAQLRFETVEVH